MGEKIKTISKGKILNNNFEIELNEPTISGQDEQIHITESDKFKEFKRDMNNFGKLQWEFEKLTL